jgi:GDP-L-fucose synthase
MKILVTGGTGMVGSAFKNIETNHELVLVGSADYNLTLPFHTENMLLDHQPDAIIHLAARVGGVKGNSDYVADFFHENILINTKLLSAAQRKNVPKVVSLLSTCVYPDKVEYPLTEDQIHNGEPHQSNFGYAYAKRMLEVQSRAIRQQYGLKYVTAIPNNIYGKNDNFDLNNGHVIPAIIRKLYEASRNGNVPTFWGDGRPLRQFTYSEDVARALLWMVENYDDPAPLNIGTNEEVSIMDVVWYVQEALNISMRTKWDDRFPAGQFRKPSTNKNFIDLNPKFEYTKLKNGLKETVAWFIKEYPNVRGA